MRCLSLSLALQIPPLPHRFPHRPRHATASSASSVAMTPAKIAIIFFAISSLLLLSHAQFVPDDFFPSSTAVSKPHQPEDAERTTAVVPPEETTERSISAAVEPFHQVDLSLRRPIGRHIHRPIDPNFLRTFRHGCRGHRHGHLGRREIPYGDDMIRFPRGPKFQRGFPGEMRQIPMRWPRMPKEFLGEMQQIPSRTPEFESGLWKERPEMVHGMREAEGREVSREEKARDGDLVKRFWAIVNRF